MWSSLFTPHAYISLHGHTNGLCPSNQFKQVRAAAS